MENDKVVGLDYEKEYHKLGAELEETKRQLQKYKEALLKLCLKL